MTCPVRGVKVSFSLFAIQCPPYSVFKVQCRTGAAKISAYIYQEWLQWLGPVWRGKPPVAGTFPHAPSRDISPPYRRENHSATSSGLLGLPIISLMHRRLSFVSGTKVKCRWGVFSSMCTTADTIFSPPYPANEEIPPPSGKTSVFPLWIFRLKNSGLAVTSVSTNQVLSFLILHPACSMRFWMK